MAASAARAVAWVAVLIGLTLVSPSSLCHAQIREAVIKYPSGDKKITVECFVPAKEGKSPAVLLLHGSGGLEQATGPIFREIASAMARNGYVVLIPHFFEKTNHVIGKPLKTGENEAMIEALKDAIQFAAKQPEVDPEKFAIIGYSMTSTMSRVVAVGDPRVRALASWSGAYPPIKPNKKLPPILILHGSKDSSTPLKYVQQYIEGLKELAMPHDSFIYQGMAHNFDIERFEDATVRTVAFFDKHVKMAKPLAR